MNPRQQAQLEQSQQARQRPIKTAMQDELEQIIVYQAAKMRELEQQLIQANNGAMQLQAVLQNSEQVSQQRLQQVAQLESDLEVVRQYLAVTQTSATMPIDRLVQEAREYASRPKQAPEVMVSASPAPAPQTPAEFDA